MMDYESDPLEAALTEILERARNLHRACLEYGGFDHRNCPKAYREIAEIAADALDVPAFPGAKKE